MKYLGFSTVVALALILVFVFLFYADMRLPFYVAWLVSLGLTTLIFFWADKQLAKVKRVTIRVPEHTLNLLTVAGGFVGAWIARGLFRHKTNIRKHQAMFAVLILSTLIHGALIYLVLFWERQ
jgi:uncharacterized membrane protein YsdA (DUF1294 family)